MIQVAIDMSKALRGHLVMQAEIQKMPADVINRLRSTSAFIGKSFHSIRDGKFLPPLDDSTCLQCLKKYTLFNRRNECGHCMESYCGECVSETVESNSKKINVCTCCAALFGKSKGNEDD